MGLRTRLRYVLLLLGHWLGAPARRRDAKLAATRAHELALITAQAEAQAKVFAAISQANIDVVTQLVEPLTTNAKVLTTWLEGFKTTTVPTAQVITPATEMGWERDEAEATLEKGRLEDRELFLQAWADPDGRLAPPVGPGFDFLS